MNKQTVTIEGLNSESFPWPSNFEGRATKFTPEGARSFSILLSDEQESVLLGDGWNVKRSKEDEDGISRAYIDIAVSWKFKPPTVVVISDDHRTLLNESTIGIIDSLDIETMDIIFRPYDYSLPTGSGRKAYLQTMFVTIRQDDLLKKYGFGAELGRSAAEEASF